ncbi:beta-ketoacyl synthase N-terminal-like domain-containing protein [Ectopseudomonas alcaliphila]|uniref:beta-ketoacyl synthase N-terminal-like domain-containing protein n=1 Tax=Ectopseudomonas alcaliphila TaxID=101564 RepID=UPI0027850F17|nr:MULTISPECIES: beta-ketoacyl synthase N-terminal-like domain-containing protein [Pseudomonas]MDP9938523.1 3-oxoacyl-[acyl-carrier-protein] synthase-1 [Pseudomonas sp. 3400]MDR7010746.1 3-oxoacyl-[acyl-carrier-protein] synthase-1 [Pseudomonas alcaliphila]
MTPIYLQRGTLHSALGADLRAAGAALQHGQLPVPGSFLLHELQQPRPYLAVGDSGESREQRCDRLLGEALGDRPGGLDDCLLIITSTSLDINDLEQLTAAKGGFHTEHSTSLDLLADDLRQRWGFADAFTLNTACTSAANGLLYGARMLAAGLYERVLVLAFETPSAIAQQGFGALDLTSPSGAYRPFHPQRDGLILGEAYAATLLSREPGAAPLARLLGGFSACDTSNLTTTREDGSHIDWVMREALRNAGVSAEQIGLVKLHGTATGANDRAESNGVRLLFGDALPPLCVLKPWLGHTLGACGLSETLLLVNNLASLPGLDYAAEALLPLSAQPTSIAADSLLLANFFGFGGNNASLILQSCAGNEA